MYHYYPDDPISPKTVQVSFECFYYALGIYHFGSDMRWGSSVPLRVGFHWPVLVPNAFELELLFKWLNVISSDVFSLDIKRDRTRSSLLFLVTHHIKIVLKWFLNLLDWNANERGIEREKVQMKTQSIKTSSMNQISFEHFEKKSWQCVREDLPAYLIVARGFLAIMAIFNIAMHCIALLCFAKHIITIRLLLLLCCKSTSLI